VKYQIIAPLHGTVDSVTASPTLPGFSLPVIDFVDSLSEQILGDHAYRRYPELIAMAFWMRKSQIRRMANGYFSETVQTCRTVWQARGLVFHIAPANVDTIFLYSSLLSMLVGNRNIIRLSSKHSDQLDLLLGLINELLQDQRHKDIRSRLLLVRYEHDDETTAYFSSLCDARVIWGGDETIRAVRKIPLPPTATELTFADKFSFCLIQADAFMAASGKADIVTRFYNDAYWFGQMACSSPRLVVWCGEEHKDARALFWRLMAEKIDRASPEIATADIINKLVAGDSIAVEQDVAVVAGRNNYLNRIELKSLAKLPVEHHCGAGLFYEFVAESLEDLLPIISRKIQTVSVFGYGSGELSDFIVKHQLNGIDRIVPIGKALDFSARWDGYDLLREFSRCITVNT
jgi:hypothetical protein